MEKTMMLPATYNVLSQEEMTYAEGGATATQAVCAWLIPFYGWYKGSKAVHDYRKQNPNTWLDTGLDALASKMDKSVTDMIYTVGCAAQVISVCSTGIGILPTAYIIFKK